MNTAINIIKITLLIGLIIFIYFALIKKLSNNYKVLILPFITLINSIIFGYKAYSNGDDITLIIWFVIFLTSLLLIVLVFRKIYSEKYKPTQTTINNTEINHNYQTNIDTIDNSNTFNTSQTNNHLVQNNNVTNIDTVDNSNTFNTSQTNNHLEQINNVTNIDTVDNSNTFNTSQTNNHLEQNNNVTNIESKPQTNYEKKNKNSKDLDDIKLENLYKNLLKYEIINDNINFEYFKSKFLKEIIILNNLSLAEYKLFYDKLKSTFYIDIKHNEFCDLFNLNNNSYKNTKDFKDYHFKKIDKIFENV